MRAECCPIQVDNGDYENYYKQIIVRRHIVGGGNA